MRFGITNHEEEIALARAQEQEFEEIKLGVWRRERPDAAQKEHLALWMLEGLGIVEAKNPNHPAVTIFLELLKRRQLGEGISGPELVGLVDVGKTQTYYWLNKMKQARLVGQGKKKVIERGAKRELKGFYLNGPDLSYTLGEMKKHVADSFDDMISVSERLHQVVHHETSVLRKQENGAGDGGAGAGLKQQAGSIPQLQQSESSE